MIRTDGSVCVCVSEHMHMFVGICGTHIFDSKYYVLARFSVSLASEPL